MTIYRGLNVAKSLSDISNSDVALANIGLRSDNLDLIRNLSTVITRDEIHTLSGLVDNQRELLRSMENAAAVAGLSAARIRRADTDQIYNYDIDSKLICGTIKFNYIDFTDASWTSRGADISTSRVSSWSPFGPPEEPDRFVIYNSDVHVKGKYLSVTDLSLTKAPERKRFLSEVATHIVKINVNGKTVSFPVMRGIPFKMIMTKPDPRITFYTTTILRGADGRNIPFSVVREDLETGEEIGEPYLYTPSKYSTYNLYQPGTANVVAEEVLTKFYYNPALIRYIISYNNGIEAFPKSTFSNLTSLTLYKDNLEYMPDFKTYTPSLSRIDLKFQKFFNAPNHANENNLNGDGSFFDGSIQSQLLRLPVTTKYFDFRNSFEGDARGLDLSHLPVLETPLLGAYNRSSRYPQIVTDDDIGIFPSSTLRVNFNPQTALNVSNGVFTITEHGLKSGNYVRYNVRVNDDDDDKTTIEGTLGTVIGGLVDDSIYKVASVTDANTFTLQTTQNQVIGSYNSTGTGTLHSFVVWDIEANDGAGDILYNKQTGLKSWSQNDNTELKYVPMTVSDSKRLTTWDIRSCPNLQGISEYRFFDDSTVATTDRSNEDRKHYLATDLLTKYSITNTKLTYLDYSKWSNTLTNLVLSSVKPLDSFPESDRTLTTSKLAVPKLTNLQIKSNGSSTNRVFGDITGAFANKPSLGTVTFGANMGLKFELDDNTFSGSEVVRSLTLTDGYYNNLDEYLELSPFGIEYDMFGLEGEAGSNKTGKIFENIKNRMNVLYLYRNYYTPTKFINGDRSLGIEDFNTSTGTWRPLHVNSMQVFGTFPNISGINGRTFSISGLATVTVPMFAMKPGEAYRFSNMDFNATGTDFQFYASNDTSGGKGEYDLTKEEMLDMGWKTGSFAGEGNKNSDIVPWGSDTPHGSHPSTDDWFIYQPLTANSLIAGLTYVILDPKLTGTDSTSEAEWQALGVSGTPAKGTKFTATTSANRINMADIQSGVQYKIIRTGDSTTDWNSLNSGGATSVDTVFTASGNGSSDMRINGGYVQKINTTDYGAGTVARYSMRSVAKPGTSWQLQTGTGGEIVGIRGIQYFYITNNNFYGAFPKFRQGGTQSLRRVNVNNNRFTGPIPDLSGISKVTYVNARDNSFDSHSIGTLSEATVLSYGTWSNNKLRAQDTITIINDLWESHIKGGEARKDVKLYFTGQDAGVDSQGQPIKRMCLQALKDDPGKDADNSALNKYNSLRDDYRWTIDLDTTYL